VADLPSLQFKYIVTLDEACDERAHIRVDDGREHDLDTARCWCTPTLYAVCDCDDGCWKCNDLEEAPHLTPEQAEAPDAPTVMAIHH